MRRMLGVLVAMLLTACSDIASSGVRNDAGSIGNTPSDTPRCDGRYPAFIPAHQVGPAISLGATKVRARTVYDPAYFVTACEVPLTLKPKEYHEECSPNQQPTNFNGARMAISRDVSSGKFTMQIASSRYDDMNFTVSQMQAGRKGSFDTSDGVDYLVGTLGEERSPNRRKYFVFLDDTVVGVGGGPEPTSLPLWKVYWIQVYEVDGSGNYLCPTHMPDHVSNGAEDKDLLEAGTGGGIEPGHR